MMALLWLAFGALTLAVLALVLAPLVRRPRGGAEASPRTEFDLAVYRDQLAEVERDRERGLIDAEQAEAARLEIERRILTAGRRRGGAGGEGARPPGPGGGGRRPAVAAALALVLTGASTALYLQLGSPHLPDRPLAARQDEPPGGAPAHDFASMAEGLERRLAEQPDDMTGWVMLGRVEMARGRDAAAINAFRRALALAPDEPMLLASLGEALVRFAGGIVTPEAERQFEAALAANPGDIAARYYLALAAAQSGDLQKAFDGWHGLLAEAPADAPWRPDVEAALRSVASQLGSDVAAAVPPPASSAAPTPAAPSSPAAGGAASAAASAAAGLPAPGGSPSAADAARIAALDPEERSQAIRGMVEGLAARLEAEPDDADGWLRLARARQVLGEPDLARQAFERAAALRPDQPPVLKAYAASLLGPDDPESGAPEVGDDAEGVYRRIAELDPSDPEPHWYLGLAALQDGDRPRAADHWRQVLARLTPDHPDYAAIQQWLREIEG